MPGKKYSWLFRLLVPLIISIICFIFFARQISWAEVRQAFDQTPASHIFIYLLLSVLGTGLRAIQHWLLIYKQIGLGSMFLITLVRNFSVDLLPARTAALGFYTYLTKKNGLEIAAGASSFIISVFYDGLGLAAMLGTLSAFMVTSTNRGALLLATAVIFLISLTAIFTAQKICDLLVRVPWIKKNNRLFQFFHEISHYFSQQQSPVFRIKIFLVSFLIRLIKYLSVYFLFAGVTASPFSLKNFSIFCFGLAGAELSSFLPIQGLGGFGTWELAFAFIFSQLGLPSSQALLAGLVIHVITQIWEYSLGVPVFLYLAIKKKKS